MISGSFENITLPEDATLSTAMVTIDKGNNHVALIVNDEGVLRGIVTDGDVRRAILDKFSLDTLISEVANLSPTCVTPEEGEARAFEIMRDKLLIAIPVVDRDMRLISVVTLEDYLLSEGQKRTFSSAVIMAGGEGQRLRPLTRNKPKPMMDVGGKPLIEHTVTKLGALGINNVYIAVNYLGEMISDHIGDGEDFGASVNYLCEDKKMGTAGALSLLPGGYDDTLLVMNGDVVANFDFHKMYLYHKKMNSALTVGVVEYCIDIPYGVINIEDSHIIGLEEKPKQITHINAGIYAVEPHLIEHVEEGAYSNMTDLIDIALGNNEVVTPFLIHETWIDIGTPQDLERANSMHSSMQK